VPRIDFSCCKRGQLRLAMLPSANRYAAKKCRRWRRVPNQGVPYGAAVPNPGSSGEEAVSTP